MADIIHPGEILLNSVRYPIRGQIQPTLMSQFPEKMITGDYTVGSRKDVSEFVINDQRGGVGIEEMDETKDSNRSWWSTCNTAFKGHIILPPLATVINKTYAWTTPTSVNDPTPGWTNDDRAIDESTTLYAQTTAELANGAWSPYLEFLMTSANVSRVRVWVGADDWDVTNELSIDLYYDANGGADWHNIYEGTTTAGEWMTYVGEASAVTKARVKLKNNEGSPCVMYIYEFDFESDAAGSDSGTVRAFENFNSNLYKAQDKIITRLNDAGDAFVPLYTFAANITALIAGVNSCLYIYLGDANDYWYMSTAEAFATSDEADATYGTTWDVKQWKIDSAGLLSYTATPNAADSTWTGDADLADEGVADNDVQGLYTFYNVSGDVVIYATTKKGLFVHDFANNKWIQTQLKTPYHTNSGKGFVHWRDGAYVSAGLDVLKYIPDTPAQIISMGLDRDGGMPTEYAGEIMCLIGGYNEFYALVDSSQVAGVGTSTVMAYDGKGWRCMWDAGTTDDTMHTGIVSSVVAYRLWFDHDDKVYSIPLHRNLRNPLKIDTDTHDTVGAHVTPWFDANWVVGSKLALKLKVAVYGDVSADEDVVVDYRIDHATTTIPDNGWTNLGTIEAAGVTTYTFGTNVGIEFKAIQFRFTLARKGADTDETPDLQYAVLSYQKVIPPLWGWRFTIDCTKSYPRYGASRSPEQLLDAIVTAAELQTLVAFQYDATVRYVQVKSVEGERLTGEGRKGLYNILVQELE